MPTFKEFAKHLLNNHDMRRDDLLEAVAQAEGDITVVHDNIHANSTPAHSHDVDGNIVTESKTVLTDKSITMTSDGWSFDSTAAEALQELNSIINNRPCKVIIDTKYLKNGRIYGEIEASDFMLSVEGDTFLDIVRLLLGETYERINNE